ncbi:ATP-binding cassette domain-containing protein [Kineococcus aurantiacus]|uniref:Oleandomycin transport system ATP-binding protein n=1 Tax=Kineococcus aurantiacus TaxID=37633 RepID=A0A7Y9DP34_9ACTN|nr:ATP-binding cassette domain-containing protein [Kineococcus aurantiacus]NYD24182.1 oleandomycin transport system ATP-binding protein [Kineococcus aurantiacus]
MTYAIEADGLRKRFGDTRALDGVSLAVAEGKVLGVLGPNGAGKTTAVRVLATLLRPDSGTARIGGHDVVREAAAVRRTIGLTGQYASVDEDLTGRQNLLLIGALLDLSRRDARRRADELLEWFDLTGAASRPAGTYSGGMRRRLDLAASLVGRPAVVFLDEPTTGLDPAKRDAMWDVVRTLVAEGSTILLTTQYLEEADQLADEITVIDHGRVIAHDTPLGLKRQAGNRTLTVVPADAAHAPVVRSLLAAVSSEEPTALPAGGFSVPVLDEAVVGTTVSALAGRGVALSELSLHLPTLDEVFSTLTQHEDRTRDRNEKEVAA